MRRKLTVLLLAGALALGAAACNDTPGEEIEADITPGVTGEEHGPAEQGD